MNLVLVSAGALRTNSKWRREIAAFKRSAVMVFAPSGGRLQSAESPHASPRDHVFDRLSDPVAVPDLAGLLLFAVRDGGVDQPYEGQEHLA